MPVGNFTPGPWRAVYTPKKLIDDGSGEWCVVPPEDDPDDCRVAAIAYGPADERRAANARLIAAAPELLAACEKLIAAHEAYMDDDSQAYPHAVLEILGDELDTAVAKAKGGA
jgi:hypothetical protein